MQTLRETNISGDTRRYKRPGYSSPKSMKWQKIEKKEKKNAS